jgi:hypothetical protein
MDKKGQIAIVAALIIATVFMLGIAFAKPAAAKQCNDGIDNDGDGYTDYPSDPGCSSRTDNSELNANVQCDDGIDNDGDGAIDYHDGGCSGPTDNDETNCGDGVCEGGETNLNCHPDCGYPNSCSDTDGGNVITVYGTTSGYFSNSSYSHNDYCVDTSNVNEYYCSGVYEQSSQQSCGTDYYGSSYCNGSSVYHNYYDYYCSSGACSSTVNPELVETCISPEVCSSGQCIIPNSCSDTDGGYVPQTQGTTSGYLSEVYYSHTDYCQDNATLKEYYCSSSLEYNNLYWCSGNYTSCSSGKCI